MVERYDIVIVGGGMVGAALACALKHTSYRIALIDAAITHAEDKRFIALNHSSCVLLTNLGLWHALAAGAAAIREVHVSHRGHFGTTRLNAAEMRLNELGHVVPAKYINIALYDQLAALEKLTLLRPAKLISLDQHESHATLTIETPTGNKTLDASIVIAADGTHSTVRELLNIQTETIDYQHKALVTVTELQRDHHHIAYERFLAEGAIAMLPLTGLRVATIWSGKENDIDALLKLSDADFLQQLQHHFGYRLGQLQKTEQRFSYAIKLVKAKEQIKHRVMLVGNAAHTVHPIAAQGLNLALYEIAVLAEHLSKQLDLSDIPSFLKQQNASINISHYLTRLFSTDFCLFNTARQIGMVGLDMCIPIKQKFAQRVLGRMGKLPSLLIENE